MTPQKDTWINKEKGIWNYGGAKMSDVQTAYLSGNFNKVKDYLHKVTSEIVKREPSFICIEDLNVSGMMKNKHLSKAIQQQEFYEFRRQIEYKSAWNNIPVIIADRFFPSSKLCSCCGSIKKDLKLSERIYKCECGNVIDRDFQAALNLKRYGENVLKESVA